MALRAKIVDFVGLRFLDDANQVAGVGQVAVVQLEFGIVDMWVLVDVIYPLRIERACAALDAVHDIAFLKQKFSEIAAVLAGDAGDECGFGGHGEIYVHLF